MTTPIERLRELEAQMREKASLPAWQLKRQQDWASTISAVIADMSGEAVAWLRYGPDGKPDWSEDCLSDRDELDSDQIADGYTMRPLYTSPQPKEGSPIDVEDVLALVAGPFKYHHKMNDLQISQAQGFDHCRDMTIMNIKTHFAMLAAAPQPDQSNER